MITLRGWGFLVSRTDDAPPVCGFKTVCTFKTFPCVPASCSRVFKHMWTCCWHTRGRLECTHRGLLNLHTGRVARSNVRNGACQCRPCRWSRHSLPCCGVCAHSHVVGRSLSMAFLPLVAAQPCCALTNVVPVCFGKPCTQVQGHGPRHQGGVWVAQTSGSSLPRCLAAPNLVV